MSFTNNQSTCLRVIAILTKVFDCSYFSRRILHMSVWPQVAAACKGVQFSVSRAFTSAPNSTKTNGLVYISGPIQGKVSFDRYEPFTSSLKSSIQLWCNAVRPSSSPWFGSMPWARSSRTEIMNELLILCWVHLLLIRIRVCLPLLVWVELYDPVISVSIK